MNGIRIFLITIVIAFVLIAGLMVLDRNPSNPSNGDPLVLYCAAGMQMPVDEIVKDYEREYGVSVQVSYGGSGTLLGNLQITPTGDLYLAADESYIQKARTLGLVAEAIPLATIHLVLVVPKGNPMSIRSEQDLLRKGVRVALANPDAAAVGKTTKNVLTEIGIWDGIQANVTVLKPTVNDITNDVKIGSVDVGIVWDAVARQYPDLEVIETPGLSRGENRIYVGILQASKQPTAALRFARYIGARDKGLVTFQKFHFTPVEGDAWAEVPHVTLFSGGVNRLAVEKTLEAFQKREGIELTTVYNGCGILVGQMKLGDRPDAYFSCDVSFVKQVNDLFYDPLNVSETDMVILVPKGNPKQIKTLEDLAQPGLRLGTANPEQSALGALTKRLMEAMQIYDKIRPNIKSQTPTADLLVNQIRTGSLDAVIVYEANTVYVRDDFELIHIDHPAAKAIQPYAVGKSSKYPHLMKRLMDTLCSAETKKTYQSMGFRWLADKENE